ncbi:MAG: hypothetical protein ACRCW9_09780 [Cetobacterium sp.]
MTSKKLAELTYEEFFVKSKEGISLIDSFELAEIMKGKTFASDYLYDLCVLIKETTKLTSENMKELYKEIVELFCSSNLTPLELISELQSELLEKLDLHKVSRLLSVCIIDAFEINEQFKGSNYEGEQIRLVKGKELVDMLLKNPNKLNETVKVLKEVNTPEHLIESLIERVNYELNKPNNFIFATGKNYEGTVDFNGSYREEKFKPKFKFNKEKGITDEQHAFNLNQLVQIFELQDEELLEKYLEKVENILNEEFYPEYADKYFEMLLNGIVKILGGTR